MRVCSKLCLLYIVSRGLPHLPCAWLSTSPLPRPRCVLEPQAWEPFNDAAPAAGAPSVVPDLMQWSVHSQRCPEGEGPLPPTPDLWAFPGGDCATSTNVSWLPELPGLDLNGTAGSTRVHTPHPNGSSGADRLGLRKLSLDLGDLPCMGSPTAAAVALAGSQVDAATGLSSSGAAGCAGAGANSRAQAEPAGSAASGCGLPRAAAASSGAKADPAALEQLVLFSKLLVEAMGETGEGESPAGQVSSQASLSVPLRLLCCSQQ